MNHTKYLKVFFVIITLVLTIGTFPKAEAATPYSVPVKLSPAHLLIPAANVDAHIINVGITTAGNLDVPHNYTEVGWYKNGPLPGEIGNVVVDGHVDNGGKTQGPFKHLREVKKGDLISITMTNGNVVTYAVTTLDVYKTTQFPSKKIFQSAGHKYLKLITCHGTYIPSINTYDQRLVVTAELVEN